MTATGALIARHVTDLFPTQTSRFDLAQAARRGVDLAAALRAHPARPGRAHDRQGAAAPRRGGHRVRPGDAGRAARPAAVQPGDRRPLQDALQRRAGRRLRRRRARTPTTSPRRSATLGHEGAGGLGRDAQARAGRDPRPLRARRHRRALSTRSCSPRAGTRPRATVCMHLAPTASKRDLPAAGRPRHAPRSRARRRASSSTSSTRRPRTTSRSSRCTRCSTATSTAAARSSSARCAAAAAAGCASSAGSLPVSADENRRIEVFERELWRIAVEHLDYGEQVQWAALGRRAGHAERLAARPRDAALRPGPASSSARS